MRKLMSKKGFTLVELMIVIVIMGILVAVAIPVYGAVTKNAETKTCKSNMSSIKSTASTWQMTGGTDGGQISLADGASIDLAANASFKNQFDGGKLPQCPVAKDDDSLSGTAKDYTAVMKKDATNGQISTTVTCPEKDKGYDKHVAD